MLVDPKSNDKEENEKANEKEEDLKKWERGRLDRYS